MAILKDIRKIASYRLYANGSPESTLSNRGCGISEIIVRVEILNFEKKKTKKKTIFAQKFMKIY